MVKFGEKSFREAALPFESQIEREIRQFRAEVKTPEKIFGFQIQGTIRSTNKEDAEFLLHAFLINHVEGISQIIIR